MANRNPGNFSVSGNVKHLEFFSLHGDGVYPVIVNKTALHMEGLLLIDGQRVWVEIPRGGIAKLPRNDYEKIALVDERIIYLPRKEMTKEESSASPKRRKSDRLQLEPNSSAPISPPVIRLVK